MSTNITIGNTNGTYDETLGNSGTLTVGNGNDTVDVSAGSKDTIAIGNGNDTVVVSAATQGTVSIGNGNDNITLSGGSHNTITVGNGNDTVNASTEQSDVITLGNGNDTVVAGVSDTVVIGNGNSTSNVTIGQNSTVTIGNGNNSVNITAAAADAVTVGNGNNNVTITGATGSTITAGNGNDTVTVTGGSGNTITAGNGNNTVQASADHNDTITVGNGNDTVYLGANDTTTVGKGNDLLILPTGGTSLSAPTSLTVLEDHSIALGISASLGGAGFGQEKIYGFAAADQLQFSTAQFASFAAVTAAAKQVGSNTVITLDASDTITLENVQLSSLQSKNFVITSGGGSSSSNVTVTITGVPSDATLSAGTKNSNGSWTLTATQLSGLMLNAGEVTTASLTVTATNTATGSSVSDTIALTVNPVAPTLTAPTSLTANEDGTVALSIGETPFDSRDTVSLTIAGVPSDATLSAGTKNSNGSWTLTPAQLAGLTLKAGEVTTANLTVTATNTEGSTASTSDSIALTVKPVAPALTAPTSLSVNEDGTVALSISETPFDSRDTVSLTIAGVPSDATLSAGTKNSNGSWTLTPAQLAGLTLKAGEVTTASLTVTATNTEGSTASTSDSIALTVNPVAPKLTAPTSLTVNADSSIALSISETPFDARDTVSITITGVPSDATLSAGTNNGGGSWTLTPAQLAGLTLNAGNATVATLTVTATNTQGATASISDSIALTINPVLALSVAVVDNLAVQEGQTLVASATINGDPADAGATINYQWQSSSDGGVTWTNVSGVPGNYNNGVLSSFLQLTEQDEGLQFRNVASFTDSAGNVITSTTAPTVAVADVTPEITVPFSYTVSDLSIVKNGTQVYNDTFSQAPINSTPILNSGVPNPIVYLTLGSTWTESGGQAVFSSAGDAPNNAISGGVENFAELDTNTDPTSTAGLKESTAFTVSSTFGLTAPPTGSYGMELNDGTSTHGVDQLERLIVTRISGNTVVELVQANLTTNPNTQTVLASQTLTAAQLANNNQIEFQFTHAANTTAVTGSFELLDNGAVTSTTTFTPTASIFIGGVDWTRVDIGAFMNPSVGLNVAAGQSPVEGQTLTASAATNDADATINYQWQSSADGGQTWTAIAGAANSANYVVQQSDENHDIRVVASTSDPDNPQSETVTSVVTGPVIDNASLSVALTDASGGTPAEGQIMVASGTITGDPSDLTAPISYQWQTSSDGGVTWSNVAATTSGQFNGVLSSFYQFGEQDEGNIFRVQASFTDDTGQVVTATSAPTATVGDIAPIITQPFSFALDEFKVVKAANTFDDTFTQGPPPVGGFLGSNLLAFNTNNGSIVPEVNGKAILTATGSTPNATLATTDSTGAVLLTNSQPEGTGPGQSELGLKEDATFSTSATFDLAAPGIATYGLELLNGTTSPTNTQVVQLDVQGNGSGGTDVALYETNLVTGVHTLLASQILTAAQLSGDTQIELDLAHNTANSQAITASFELYDNGVETFSNTFATTGTEFSTTTFVKAGVFASAPPSVAITGIAQEGQTLTAVAVTNDADATINYQWQESSNGTSWTNIGTNSATYMEQASDAGSFIRVVATTSDPDNPQSATATSQATGAVAAVAPGLVAPGSVTVNEDGSVGLPITVTPANPGDPIAVTISGIPSDVGLTDSTGVLDTSSGSVTQTPAQLAGLTLTAGAAESALLTVTATNEAGNTASTSQNIFLNVSPVAPTIVISQPSLSVNEDGSVSLPISVTPFDPRDDVAVTIGGILAGDTLTDGDGDVFTGNGPNPTVATLSLAQFDSGVTLTVGPQIYGLYNAPFELVVQATNTAGSGASAPEQFLPVTVDPVAPSLSAPTSLTVNEDGSIAVPITVRPFDPSDNVAVTITGIPSDATLTDGNGDVFSGAASYTLTLAQVRSGLTFDAGEVTSANLTVAATNAAGPMPSFWASTSQTIELTVDPVAPALSAPTSLTVNADSSIALSISELPFDARDTVSITITGVPSDATLSAGTNNGGGSWTLTPAQLAGLTLNAGNAAVTTLTVTATNTQGVTASTSDSIALTINPVLALSVAVVDNLAVQEGQTLVASATINGDPADAGATINYQWQSSSDGGVTWTNVSGVPGNYNNGVLSSFLQLTEQDEGLQFRNVASFTDSAGNVITSTTAPTVAVADVTPEITVPFSYTVSDLSIVKNGTQIYNDTFSQAPINSTPILNSGVPNPNVFLTLGGTWTEVGGQAVTSSAGVAPNPAISGGVEDFALLNSNTDPTSTAGLKEGAAFTVSSTFGLTPPPTGSYGMELEDGTSTHGVDQLERLIVTRISGNTVVELVQANLTTNPNTQTVLASQTLTAAQLANNNQIEFQFTHAANTTAVTGSFELLDNGAVTSTTTFTPTASIFTGGVDWTRVDVGAFTNPGVGLNVAAGQSPVEGQTLTASAATNDADATINYQWEESSSAAFTTFTDIGSNSANYVVQESDVGSFIRVVATTSDPDNPQSATATSSVTGAALPAAPALSAPASLTLNEDTPLDITAIALTAANPSDPLSMSLSVGHGTLALISGSGLTVTSNGSNGTLSFSGSQSAISAALTAGVDYDPAANYSGGDTLTVTGTNTAGATASTTRTVVLTVEPGTFTFNTLDYPGALDTSANGINNAGVIVGDAATDSQHSTGWDYNGATYSAIGVSGSQDNDASGINNSGVIVGFNSPVRSTPRYGFVDNNGSYSQINVSPPGISTTADAINDSGVIVGASYLYNGTEYSAFIDNGGTFTFINAPGTNSSSGYTVANGINDAGEVVGTYNTNYFGGNAWQGFTYQNGIFTTLDDPLGTNGTFAQGVNDAGQVVGSYLDSANKSHGFLYSAGVFTTIDDPSAGSQGTSALGINDSGEIVGYYIDSSGVQHGFTAIDPPTASGVIANGDTAEFGPGASQNIQFAGPAGTLQLDQSQYFTGQIAGFGGQDQIDLGDIEFGANTALGYAANSDNSGGTLTASDGIHTANLALLGQYTAASFATASDGHGGTMIAEPPIQAQAQLTQPHA